MAARLGNVLYWVGCGIAAIFACLIVIITIDPGEQAIYYGGIYTLISVGSWLVGRSLRYILAGT